MQDAEAAYISIHALLAESDCLETCHQALHYHFYPRSPCGERRWASAYCRSGTLISIHALLAESDFAAYCTAKPGTISIHALLAESDATRKAMNGVLMVFLSTLSLRRATKRLCAVCCRPCISIHALLAESDFNRRAQNGCSLNFYPRSPCGERRRKLVL